MQNNKSTQRSIHLSFLKYLGHFPLVLSLKDLKEEFPGFPCVLFVPHVHYFIHVVSQGLPIFFAAQWAPSLTFLDYVLLSAVETVSMGTGEH